MSSLPLAEIERCRACPRLAAHLDELRGKQPAWHNAPVAPHGDPSARVVIVGLAPGRTGANRTGVPFTGDASGDWLWATLAKHGFASKPEARDAAPRLTGAILTNAVKCVPPGNRPSALEMTNCRVHLAAEVDAFADARVFVALGRVAHEALLRVAKLPLRAHGFAHGAVHAFGPGRVLVDSFHPSPLNTRTGRMPRAKWNRVWEKIARLARDPAPSPWSVYLVRCGDGTLYAGITNDLAKRFAAHASGAGARYTRSRGADELVWSEPAPTKGAALSREHAVKSLSRAQKLALIATRR